MVKREPCLGRSCIVEYIVECPGQLLLLLPTLHAVIIGSGAINHPLAKTINTQYTLHKMIDLGLKRISQLLQNQHRFPWDAIHVCPLYVLCIVHRS